MTFFLRIFSLLAVVVELINYCQAQNNHSVSEAEIFDFIFSNYSKRGRPVLEATDPVVVEISLRLFGVVDFNERENTLILDGYFSVYWHDDFLVWNDVYPYNRTKFLITNAEDVWNPDLSVINAPGNVYSVFLNKGVKVWIRSDGRIYMSPASEIAVKCEVDLTVFPFDEQVCDIRVESWNYPDIYQQFRLFNPAFGQDEKFWTQNKQWDIVENASFVRNVTYGDEYIYHSIIFALKLRRKALFYYINVIIPSLIIAVVEIVTFVLPITDVVKVHISFTCLLAYSVFQTMIVNDMPKSSECVPLLSLYIDLQMAYIGLIALLGEGLVFIILRKARLHHEPPPNWLNRACHILGTVLWVSSKPANVMASYFEGQSQSQVNPLCVHYPVFVTTNMPVKSSHHSNNDEMAGIPETKQIGVDEDRSATTSVETSVGTTTTTVAGRHPSHSYDRHIFTDEEIKEQWVFVAEVVERFNMWVYLAAITLTPAIMFTALSPKPIDITHHKKL